METNGPKIGDVVTVDTLIGRKTGRVLGGNMTGPDGRDFVPLMMGMDDKERPTQIAILLVSIDSLTRGEPAQPKLKLVPPIQGGYL